MSEPQSLKEKTAKGLLWGGVSNGVQQVLNLVFGIFLARLLSPADYGMVGMLTIFSLIASTIQESGFTAALANKRDIRHEDYNAVFWFCVLCGGVLYAILFCCAPLIAAYYRQPELVSLSRYSFLGFFISSFGIAHNACLFRNLKVRQNALVGMVGLTVSGCVGVLLAYNGFAYWGLVTQTLVFSFCITAGRWCVSGWHPTFSIDFRPLKGMLAFSSRMLMTNIMQTINNNILTVILGRYYSPKDVGYYNQANKWNYMGFSTIQGMVNGVAQPVLHNVEESRARQVKVFRKMLRFTSFVSFPCLFGLALVAPELITIAITDKWLTSAGLMQIICVGGSLVPLQNLYNNLIVSKGRSDVCLWNTVAFGIVQITSALVCYRFGMHVLVMAYVGINVVWMFVWHFWAWREIRLPLWDALKDVLPFGGIAAVCILCAAYVSAFFQNIYGRLAVKIGVAVVLYIAGMYLSRSVTFRECVQFLKNKSRRT